MEAMSPLAAAALWAGANLLVTLVLALNVTRHRMRTNVAVGAGGNAELERVIRAHGNNVEYVPAALGAIVLLALTGSSTLTVHCLGGALLAGRLAHSHGIRIIGGNTPPPTRVVGNMLTWGVFAVSAILLIVNGLSRAAA